MAIVFFNGSGFFQQNNECCTGMSVQTSGHIQGEPTQHLAGSFNVMPDWCVLVYTSIYTLIYTAYIHTLT